MITSFLGGRGATGDTCIGREVRPVLRGFRVRVMKAAQDGGSPHSAAGRHATRARRQAIGNAVRQALVRPITVEVDRVLAQDAAQVRLAEDQEMVQALAPHAPEEAFANGVLSGRPIGRAQDGDAGGPGDAGECRALLAVVVAQ